VTFQYADLDNGLYGGNLRQPITLLPGAPYRLALANTVLKTEGNPDGTLTAGEFIKDSKNNDIVVNLVDQAGNLINNTQRTTTGGATPDNPRVIAVADTTGLERGMVVQGNGVPPPTVTNNIPRYTTIEKIDLVNKLITVSSDTTVPSGTTLTFDP